VLRLLDEGGEVRAYGDGDTSMLRAAGAFVASGSADDEGRLEAACADVHTVVHVGGGLLTADPDRIVRDVEVLLHAVEGAQVQRLIALSLPGADPVADDAVRRAKAEVERLVADAPVPTIVIRASLVVTQDLGDAMATVGLGPEARGTQIAPIHPDDLVELIVAFDRARSRAATGHLLVSADGPERCTIEELLQRRGVGEPGQGGLIGRRLPPAWLADQLDEALQGPWWTDDPLVLDGWAFAGFEPRQIAPQPPAEGSA
jgi:uncharacterized protein YbjT (DUF2867 family)